MLPQNQILTGDIYCSQFVRSKEAVQQKCPQSANRRRVTFQHDNARPHSYLATRQKLVEFFWDVLPHPPYSPDLAPSDYHLCRSLKQSSAEKTFEKLDCIRNHLDQFFDSREPTFWEKGILDLSARWAKVIEQNDTYLIRMKSLHAELYCFNPIIKNRTDFFDNLMKQSSSREFSRIELSWNRNQNGRVRVRGFGSLAIRDLAVSPSACAGSRCL